MQIEYDDKDLQETKKKAESWFFPLSITEPDYEHILKKQYSKKWAQGMKQITTANLQ